MIHAISGCDTTSRPFGVGKRSTLRKLQSSQPLCTLAAEFLSPKLEPEQVIDTGEEILVQLFGGIGGDSLDTLRFKMFCTKVARGTSFLHVHCLPPTSAAAKHHTCRVYLQVQEWAGNSLDPQEWGWKIVNGTFIPKTTEVPPAPAHLLSVIRCNCKADCDTRRCTFRKHGLECTTACGGCHGLECSNVNIVSTEDDEET